MKLLADEHVSPKIVRAVCENCLKDGWSFETIRSHALNGLEDESWIAAFARCGGSGILSADRRMLRRPTLLGQLIQTGIIAVYLPAEWSGNRVAEQTKHILYWWPKIEERFSTSPKGGIWLVPKGTSGGTVRPYLRKAPRES